MDECGSDVDAAIDSAVEYGEVAEALQLMQHPDATPRKWTRQWALRKAAMIGEPGYLRAALELPDIDINSGSGGCWGTALSLAAEAGHLDCCRLLLERRADPQAARQAAGHTWLAVDLARKCQHKEVEMLLAPFEQSGAGYGGPVDAEEEGEAHPQTRAAATLSRLVERVASGAWLTPIGRPGDEIDSSAGVMGEAE